MGINWHPWISKEIYGYPWIPIDTHGYPWISTDIHWYLWISMDILDIHGYPWTSIINLPIINYSTGWCLKRFCLPARAPASCVPWKYAMWSASVSDHQKAGALLRARLVHRTNVNVETSSNRDCGIPPLMVGYSMESRSAHVSGLVIETAATW